MLCARRESQVVERRVWIVWRVMSKLGFGMGCLTSVGLRRTGRNWGRSVMVGFAGGEREGHDGAGGMGEWRIGSMPLGQWTVSGR